MWSWYVQFLEFLNMALMCHIEFRHRNYGNILLGIFMVFENHRDVPRVNFNSVFVETQAMWYYSYHNALTEMLSNGHISLFVFAMIKQSHGQFELFCCSNIELTFEMQNKCNDVNLPAFKKANIDQNQLQLQTHEWKTHEKSYELIDTHLHHHCHCILL